MASTASSARPSQWTAGPAVQASFPGPHRGFVPPARNQHQRSATSPLSNEYNPNQPSIPQAASPTPTGNSTGGNGMVASVGDHPRPALSTTNSGHSRVSSFFSFRKNSASDIRPNVTRSLSGKDQLNGQNVNEFGRSVPPGAGAPVAGQGHAPASPPAGQNPQQQHTRTRTLSNTPSLNGAQAQTQPAPLHPEIRSIVQLTIAHAHKIYFSGPLVRRIERQPDGHRPSKDEGWTNVWAQLGGTTLSIWDMKQIEEANKHGKEVPPAYVNITDAFVQVLGSVAVPTAPGAPPGQPYTNVIAINTAGSNLLFFSCPSTASLISWASALRLSAWEKSRLEEIYTAHLLRISINARDTPSTLVRGKMEGWVRVRVAGQTDWKLLWMVISSADALPISPGATATNFPAPKKKRMSNLFSRHENTSQNSQTNEAVPARAAINFYAGAKTKERKKAILTFSDVTQAFAVYPERPELISRSTLIKMEGTFGDDEAAQAMKLREGWILMMPELEGGLSQSSEMLKWITALHDAFELYGRPQAWTWDPRDPASLMFAYPVGPHKDLLFLDREAAEVMDPREDRTSAIRSKLLETLTDRMRAIEPGQQPTAQRPLQPPGQAGQPPTSTAPLSLPPIPNTSGAPQQNQQPAQQQSTTFSSGFQLPPLNFDAGQAAQDKPQEASYLTPIKEQSISSDNYSGSAQAPLLREQSSFILNDPSRRTVSPTPHAEETSGSGPAVPGKGAFSPSVVGSGASFAPASRFNSDKPTALNSPARTSMDSAVRGTSPANVRLPGSPVEERKSVFSMSNASVDTTNVASQQTRTNQSTASLSNSTKGTASQEPPGSPKSISMTVLTSPHSPLPSPVMRQSTAAPGAYGRDADASSILTSPHSLMTSPHSPIEPTRSFGEFNRLEGPQLTPPSSPPRQSTMTSNGPSPSNSASSYKAQQRRPTSDDSNLLAGEAGALYYMQHVDGNQPRKLPIPSGVNGDDDSDSESTEEDNGSVNATKYSTQTQRTPPKRQGTPMAFDRFTSTPVDVPQQQRESPSGSSARNSSPDDRRSPKSRPTFGRKPSGARAPAKNRLQNNHNGDSSLPSHSEHDASNNEASYQEAGKNMNDTRVSQGQAAPLAPQMSNSTSEDMDGDALAALSYLTVNDEDVPPPMPPTQTVEPLRTKSPRSHSSPSPPPASNEGSAPFKSSFAPSKQAAERKAKAQAQQAAHQAAVHKPGRSNGKRKSRVPERAVWNESSDEEEEEDEEEDDDADSDAVPSPPLDRRSRQSSPNAGPRMNKPNTGPDVQAQPQPTYPNLRPPRTLPQIPGGRSDSEDYNAPPPRRVPADQGPYYDDGQQYRPQSNYPQLGAARQSVWSQVLDPGRNLGEQNTNKQDTFIQLEPPSQTMTKAFTPQGLLSAGMQDKQDRSAKRQEELARESGASLINVPNKPPPPQTGLLGAITAHERERKREGGVGAALTEREREKRVAEERQRRFDEQQRQQIDQMQQGGAMYGGQFGYNPMMNPMMMGMNPMMGMSPMMTGGAMPPMMTGQMPGQMPYGNMMGGYNPQHMFAAQQAAQAYQQAMMAFSVAGSQVGGEGGVPGAVNPMMTGGGMGGGMGNFDPRMSMMSMMGPMGMGMGANGMAANPMQMQMTGGGMSTFDPRFPPSMSNTPPNDMGLAPPGAVGGQNHSSGTSSPARNGSPLARPPSQGEAMRSSSRPPTPKQ
ncbi:hypothetical protein PC9H_009495 [Pleurotus ostreatus]|uniref:PH domain-containing protein n=2 Tax=Pleurotus ostreatus TaxID=5322 RepID=A0A8H6ZPT7_PLEOS|nr:uncharacterized protein PC9H_009495 [Pleurotus ostreatus]KAF7424192.1 hypothetical protein PC9H_009495 [Pleurotus ostreatus]